jgi:hypothetical protein
MRQTKISAMGQFGTSAKILRFDRIIAYPNETISVFSAPGAQRSLDR